MTSTMPDARAGSAGRRAPMTPAQRVILLLGVPATLALVAWTGYSIVAATAQGSFTDAYSEPVTGSALTMNVEGGDANVEGGAATGSARLTETVDYGLVRPNAQPVLNVTHGAGGTSIDFGCQNWEWGGNCVSSGTAGVPARTAVTLSTNGGNATVGGLAAPVSASTNGGDLTVSSLTEGGTLSSDGGNVTATGITGETTILSAGGDVNADQVTGNLDVSTDGGNIQGTALSSPDISADTNMGGGGPPGGDVDLTLSSVPKNLQIVSGGGNVTLILPPGGASYDVRINADGGTVSSAVTSSSSAANMITVNSGGGDVTIS